MTMIDDENLADNYPEDGKISIFVWALIAVVILVLLFIMSRGTFFEEEEICQIEKSYNNCTIVFIDKNTNVATKKCNMTETRICER